MWLIKVFFVGHFISIYVDCQCSLPLTDGTWLTSGRGTWDVKSNGSVIENFETSLDVSQPTSNMTCNSQSGAYYILGTTIQPFSNIEINVFTCIDIRSTDSSPAKYLLHFVTAHDVTTNDRFTSDISQACAFTNYITALNTLVILQSGSETSALTTLPNVIRGIYSVNYTDVDGTDVTGSIMDSCSDVTIMDFNRSDSSRTVAFSNTGLLMCLYTAQEGDQFYVYTYNNESSVDGATTYRIACWVLSYSTTGVVGTVYPSECQSNQNATSVPSGGQSYIFIASVVCPDEAGGGSDGLSAGIIVMIVLLCCLFVAVVIIIVACYFKHKGKPKDTDEIPKKLSKPLKSENFMTVSETDVKQSPVPEEETPKGVKYSDLPMTRWSKSKFRKRSRSAKRAAGANAWHKTSHTPGAPPDGQFTYRKMYVSMAPTSLLFTGVHGTGTNVSSGAAHDSSDISQPSRPERAKTMIETSKKRFKYPIYKQQNKVVSSDITKQRLDTLRVLRTKTFHDFSKDYDKLNPFPTDGVKGNGGNGEKKGADENDSTVRSRPSTFKSRPSTTDGLGEKYDKPKQPAKRTRSETTHMAQTLVGYSYNSPYAMTLKQKQYIAQRNLWIQNMKQQDLEEEKQVMENRKQDNTEAYKAWLKNKATRTKQLKRSYVIKKKPNKTNKIEDTLIASNEKTTGASDIGQRNSAVISLGETVTDEQGTHTSKEVELNHKGVLEVSNVDRTSTKLRNSMEFNTPVLKETNHDLKSENTTKLSKPNFI